VPHVIVSKGGRQFHVHDAGPVIEARRREREAKADGGASPSSPAATPLDLGAPKGGSGESMFDDWMPYVAPNEATIPRRQWLYGKHYLRGTVSASVGAPGRLKSTTTQTEALAMVVGRDLMHGNGDDEHGELRVAYLNGEERQDELDRRHVAMCKHYNVPESAYAGRLWIKSTRDKSIRLAETDSKGRPTINRKMVTALKAWCDTNHVDVLIVDPLISFHSVRENANEDMDLLCKQGFGAVAGDSRAVELVHHPRKPAPGEVNTTVDDMRGASSVLAAVRTARTFNFMTSTEASQLRVNEDERRSYVRIENGKGGPGPVGKARWARIETETLLNGDTVAVAARWKPPENFTTVDPAHTQAIIVYARQGSWRTDPQSPDWLGWKVIEILGLKARPGKRGKLSAAEKADKDQAAAALAIWEETRVIARTENLDEAQRKKRGFYIAGPAADAAGLLDTTGDD
jgi:AAA domain